MENMKAVRVHNYGGPEVLHFEDAPRPTPGSGELLIKVHRLGECHRLESPSRLPEGCLSSSVALHSGLGCFRNCRSSGFRGHQIQERRVRFMLVRMPPATV